MITSRQERDSEEDKPRIKTINKNNAKETRSTALQPKLASRFQFPAPFFRNKIKNQNDNSRLLL